MTVLKQNRHSKMNLVTSLGFFWILLLCSPAAFSGLVVVTDIDSPFDHIAKDDIRRIYLGKKKTIRGLRVIPIDQKDGNRSRDIFYESIVRMSDAQLKSYWSRLIFTGKGQAPMSVRNDEEVKQSIKGKANRIGYIEEDQVDDQVKILYRVQQ